MNKHHSLIHGFDSTHGIGLAGYPQRRRASVRGNIFYRMDLAFRISLWKRWDANQENGSSYPRWSGSSKCAFAQGPPFGKIHSGGIRKTCDLHLDGFASALLVATGVAMPADTDEAIPFPADYRKWAVVRSLVVGPENKNFAINGGFHHYYANEQAVEGFRPAVSWTGPWWSMNAWNFARKPGPPSKVRGRAWL